MKALLCEDWLGWRGLRYGDFPPPALRPGCVRIRVAYATISFGQLLVVAGKYQRRPPLPFVPGTEISGTVMEVADDVTLFRPGDRVAASLDWGGFGEEAIATSATTWHVPDGLDLRPAAIVPLTYGTAYAALHWRARIRPGERLLVFGAAGGVGLPAVELGRLAGAKVIAVASTQERLAFAREHGASETLTNDTPDLAKRIKAIADGRGVEVVFESVGGARFQDALHCTAPEGRILVIGFAGGEIPQIPANILLIKNIEVLGFNFGLYVGWTPVDERLRHEARVREMITTLFAMAQRGEIKPVSTVCHRLGEHEKSFEAVESRSSVGRALIQIGG